MITFFDIKMANKIINMVYAYEHLGIGYRDLQRRIGSPYNRTYNFCVKTLRDYNILTKPPENKKRGSTVPIHLTNEAKMHYELGVPLIPKKFPNSKVKNQMAMQLLLSIAALGCSRLKSTSKPVAGNIAIPNPSTGGYNSYSFYKTPGVSVTDLTEHRNVTYDGLFRYIDFTKSELEELIKILREKYAIIISINKTMDGECRFGITDKLLRTFLIDCLCIFSIVLWRMEKTWFYKGRTKNELKDEFEWYEILYGKKRATDIFLSFAYREEKLKVYSKKIVTSTKIAVDEKIMLAGIKLAAQNEIKIFDKSIYQLYLKLKKEHKNILEKRYPIFSRELIDKIVYPVFLQKLHNHDPYLRNLVRG